VIKTTKVAYKGFGDGGASISMARSNPAIYPSWNIYKSLSSLDRVSNSFSFSVKNLVSFTFKNDSVFSVNMYRYYKNRSYLKRFRLVCD
jgi:hypothetical protein